MVDINMDSKNYGDMNLTILIPVFNGVEYIPRLCNTLISIFEDGFEFIVINDGSKDISASKFQEYFDVVPNCKVITKEHTGIVDSLNLGLSHCSNEFIARLDVDDYVELDRFKRQYVFLRENPNCGAVFCDYEIISAARKSLGVVYSAVFPSLVKLSLINPQRTPHPGVMFRKSLVVQVGGYRTDEFPAEDLGLWMRLSRVGDLASIPSTLLLHTLHGTSVSSSMQKIMQSRTNELISNFFNQYCDKSNFLKLIQETELYSVMSKANYRKVLSFRDLITVLLQGQFNLLVKLQLIMVLATRVIRPSLLVPFLLLFYQLFRRKIHRILIVRRNRQ